MFSVDTLSMLNVFGWPRFFLILLSIILYSSGLFASPNALTFQAKIYKPNSQPLEAATVNFRFTVTDPVGSCVLYQEDHANQSMAGSSGNILISVGSGHASLSNCTA